MDQSTEKTASWPGSTILLWGTFGKQTPEGRRYHRRCMVALAGTAIGVFLTWALPLTPGLMLRALLPGAAFSFIAWEFRRYLLSLDELARRMQLEAIAWTYLTGLAITALIGGVLLAYDLALWFPNPLWYVLLEPVRGVWLYAISRRY